MVFVTKLQNALLFIDTPFIKTEIYMPFYLFSKYLLSISSVAVSVPGFGATEKYKI